MAEDDFEGIKADLLDVTKKCKKIRKDIEVKRKDVILDNLWEAWKGRKLHEVNRLSRLLAGTGLGSQGRNYRHVQGGPPHSGCLA